ncbi:MAG: proline--tRNA ligase [Puniceicoccales bacterium]|jgi:prolyl-tRNA synthetase|nr:proline--tRNA ligase [Puniceicoccales bacterium]
MKKTGIAPTRDENYAEWYQQVIRSADLAENSPVRGCMVIKPWGYRIWETLQSKLDNRFKSTGHQNAYFPLFIPLSFLERESEHVAGFAKECAVVTHSKLKLNDRHRLEPCSPLEEPFIVRPTSETIIGEAFSRWIQSYRDLPLLINQWANVVRWEMRTRLFLRTSEFLWQEGHTAHATAEEAREETLKMLEIYRDVAENELAIPVIVGEKTASERFPGAVSTYTLEAMMQDRRALQLGTSHFLGQNFAKAMHIAFVDEDGQKKYVWTTSWGATTRLIGALIMTHSDDDGLILPPRIAHLHAIILPIIHEESSRVSIETYCLNLQKTLQTNAAIKAQVDTRDLRGGEKRWQWIKKGVCCLIEIGAKEVESNGVTFAMRDAIGQRETMAKDDFAQHLTDRLESLQRHLFNKALRARDAATVQMTNETAFYEFFERVGGFVLGYWSEDPSVESRIKNELKVTVRCLPLQYAEKRGNCLFTGKPNCPLAVFAKAY